MNSALDFELCCMRSDMEAIKQMLGWWQDEAKATGMSPVTPNHASAVADRVLGSLSRVMAATGTVPAHYAETVSDRYAPTLQAAE